MVNANRFAAVQALAMASLIGTLTACASSAGQPARDDLSPASGRAGDVASAYLRDVFSGNLEQARSLVAPASRGVFDNLKDALAHPKAVLRTLSVGDVRYRGTHASVTFLATICPTPTAALSECAVNHDAHSTDPRFTTKMTRVDSTWMVDLGALHHALGRGSDNPIGTATISPP